MQLGDNRRRFRDVGEEFVRSQDLIDPPRALRVDVDLIRPEQILLEQFQTGRMAHVPRADTLQRRKSFHFYLTRKQ